MAKGYANISLRHARASCFVGLVLTDPPVFMKEGRHGTGLGATDCSYGHVYIGMGSGNIGGGPEMKELEVRNPNLL